jgi:signal transduction histidine kinase
VFLDIYRVVSVRRRRNKDSASSNLVHVSVCCAISWSLVVGVYVLGCLNLSWFDPKTEFMMGTFLDFISKFMYANLLGDSHLHVQQLENIYMTQLQLKEEANKAQRQFLRYVFHEVRVPLNTIRLGLDSINLKNEMMSSSNRNRMVSKDDDENDYVLLNDEALLAVSRMDGAAVAMSDTLNDVLSYQTIKEGNMVLEITSFHVEDIFHKLQTGFKISFMDKEMRLVPKLDPRLSPNCFVYGDAGRIRQVPF